MNTAAAPDALELRLKSIRYRRKILEIIVRAGAGHAGGSLSCVDILNVLYNRIMRIAPETAADAGRDRFIQSKGHSAEALYVVLADRGFIPETELDTLCRPRSRLAGHPTRKIPGVELNTGALGHGLPVAAGMALAGKRDGADWRVFVLLGDGELAEGSNWEAAMAAAHYRLDNLTAVVDLNGLQITGRTRQVLDSEPLDAKFSAFGWTVRRADGHDPTDLIEVLGRPPEGSRPTVALARTVKGKGVSFMEGDARWHHGVPSEDEYRRALRELEAAELRLSEARP